MGEGLEEVRRPRLVIADRRFMHDYTRGRRIMPPTNDLTRSELVSFLRIYRAEKWRDQRRERAFKSKFTSR